MAYSADTFTAGEVPTTAKWNKLWGNDADFDTRITQSAPVGEVVHFAGSSAPTGWLLCDGAAVSRTTYAALFAIIGTTYGAGNGSTTFNVPNSKGRVIVNKNASDTEFDTLAETGGAKTHTLITAEMPNHSHTVQSFNGGAGGGGQPYNSGNTGSASFPGTSSVGGGGAHNNLQPYLTLNDIIKT